MTDVARTGGCLCAGVRYRATGPLRDVWLCHCTECMRTCGGAAAHTACDDDRFAIDADATLAWFAGPTSETGGRRGFCTRCGSTLFFRVPDVGRMFILAGSLDDATGLRHGGHIFWDSRQPWEREDATSRWGRYPA